MIIEFFGPPAVGKSTLSHALASALRAKGRQVVLYTSDRPAEKTDLNNVSGMQSANTSVGSAPLQRAGKLASVVPNVLQSVFATRPPDNVGTHLLKILPPQNWLSRLRLQRYLYALKQSFDDGRANHGITIFDQGYLTALCSIAVRAQGVNSQTLARAFASLPRPDLVICLDAPDTVLQARIALRHARQTAFERLFEQDTSQTRKQVDMVRTVAAMVTAHKWPAVFSNSTNDNIIEDIVERIAKKISTQHEAA